MYLKTITYPAATNSAGIMIRGTVDSYRLEDFDRMLAVNVRAAFVGIQAASQAMKDGGQCCNFRSAAHESHDAGVASDCNLEQPSDEMELADNLTDAHPPGLPLPNRMHRFVTLDRAVGSPERAEAFNYPLRACPMGSRMKSPSPHPAYMG